MDALTTLLKSVIALDKNKVINTSVRKNRLTITDLNTKGQLLKGVDSENDTFGLYRSVGYSLLKDKLPGRLASFGVVDLRLTGDFYKTFFVTANDSDDFFTIDANTIKDETDLAKKYGEDIIGLNEDSRDKLTVQLIPDVTDVIRKEIGVV